jgi:hypothetical protein
MMSMRHHPGVITDIHHRSCTCTRTSFVHTFFKQQVGEEVIDRDMFQMDLSHLMSNLLAQSVGLLGVLHMT